MQQHTENSLEAKVNITRYAPDRTYEVKLNQSEEWIREVLMELNEKATSRNPEDYLGETDLRVSLKLTKKNNPTFGHVLLVKGKVEAEFMTECVRTLQEMKDSVEAEFSACFIENIFAEEEEYADQVELFIENELYDLHFYELNRANIKEMLHEVIFLNINQYPVACHDTPLEYNDEGNSTKQ
ncbi:MAG: DUF177 domain-containing protein [Bacteriovoracaceae bacterium]|nr:DUF177 domain-containing protein [Bacteriovoracaceae bacterium]